MKAKLVRAISVILAAVMVFSVMPVNAAFADDGENGSQTVDTQLNGWDENHNIYYVDGVPVTGFYNINGKRYYFNPATCEKTTGLKKIDGEYYLFTDGGAMRYGWKNYNDARYYFNPKSGKGAVGLKKIDGVYYLFGDNAKMRRGFQTYNGEKYRFSPKNGKAVTGLKKVGKYYYSFTEKGKIRKGWKNVGKSRFYFAPKTGRAVKGFKKLGGGYYFFNKNCRMVTGWKTLKGKTYYFNPSRKKNYGRAVTGTVKIKGKTYHFRKNGQLITDKELMIKKAQAYSSPRSYLILVNKSTHRVGVFRGKKGNWKLVKYCKCTVGASKTPTPSGSFIMGPSGGKPFHQLYFDSAKIRCWYATRISGGYNFHSVLYTQASRPVAVANPTLGANLSHGCIRLHITNAKWIYNNIPSGTKCVIYS